MTMRDAFKLRNPAQYLSVIIAILLVSSFIATPRAFATSPANRRCDCVIFRLDDVQDHWLDEQQSAIMDLFVSHNDHLTLGLIMGIFGDDLKLLDSMKNGIDKGLFELALHGWQHVDHSTLDATTQTSNFSQANNKFKTMTGQSFTVFLPPYDKFNQATITAMANTGIRIISSDKSDPSPAFISGQDFTGLDNERTIFHLPISVAFKYFADGKDWKEVSVSDILNAVDKDIAAQGYAVVTLHPQDLAFKNNGGFDNTLDQRELGNLQLLLDSLSAKNIPTASFSRVTQLEQPKYNDIENYILDKHLSDRAALPIYIGISGAAVSAILVLVERRRKRKNYRVT